jgi:two-component system phosphate regulon sensor histidine kinase PhoR
MGAINNEEKRDYFLSQIEIHAELLNQQIQDLLTLAKVESGHAAFNIQVVSVESVCNESLAGFRDIAATRAIKLQYNSRTPDLKVRADREELLVIINNLLSNAIRYSPSDATVTVSCYAESRSAVIEVTDKGIGIAPMHQARVFERFYRVDQARSRELGGTGLGLSIVKHLTQSMGGSVHLESAVGKGSTFRIKLPLGRTENLGE